MKSFLEKSALLLGVTLILSGNALAASCDGIDRSLTSERKKALELAIAKQLHVPDVNVLESFTKDTWSIIYVDTHKADPAFLFYSQDPLTSERVTLWSGAAMTSEEKTIKAWTLKNAQGIPDNLASCFAWHVTKDRDQ